MAVKTNERPGAGRPKKVRSPTAPPVDGQVFETAEDYLAAVVAGTIAPDAVRVAAAKALLPYQTAKQRPKKASLTPTQMAVKEVRAIESSVIIEFKAKAAEIRRRHKEKTNGNR